MNRLSSSAIMIRRVDYGEADLIITFFTRNMGKLTAIAKSARKSKRRFAGILEPFSILDIVCRTSRRCDGLHLLEEASLDHPFINIRHSALKTAYAGYWAELIYEWTEEADRQTALFDLFCYVLDALDQDARSPGQLSILFQLRFVDMSGFCPNLSHCVRCGTPLDRIPAATVYMDVRGGGLLCHQCSPAVWDKLSVSKGVVKQLLWVCSGSLETASRVRFSDSDLQQGLQFLEFYLPFHLGKSPRSLSVLRRIRGGS